MFDVDVQPFEHRNDAVAVAQVGRDQTLVHGIVVRDDVALATDASRPPEIERSQLPSSGSLPCQRGTTGEHGGIAEFGFDPDELVVLGYAIGTCGGTGLDLSAVHGDGKIRDRCVLGLT